MEQDSAPVNMSGMPRRFISLRQVHPGMTQREVASVLGNDIIVGYEMNPTPSVPYKPLTMKNPYRTEQIRQGLRSYEIVYYLQGVKKADGQISDDELIPLIFENDRLAGSGWDFLNKVTNTQ